MKKIDVNVISQVVENILIKASTSFRDDQIDAYKKAIEIENDRKARWVLENILRNAEVAKQKQLPLCDDTGIPHIFLEIGDQTEIPAGFFAEIDKGIALGLRRLPGRPMGVKGNGIERISQSKGLYDDPAMVLPAPFQLRRLAGRQIKLTVLMYGGGPEIRGKTQSIFHKHSLEVVKHEMIDWALKGSKLLGCTPSVLAFGIGRSNVEASSLALEAMKDGDFGHQSQQEKEITNEVNKSNIGPLGLGGITTVLGTFIKIGPQRASGVRVVSLRVGCCFDPRKVTYILNL